MSNPHNKIKAAQPAAVASGSQLVPVITYHDLQTGQFLPQETPYSDIRRMQFSNGATDTVKIVTETYDGQGGVSISTVQQVGPANISNDTVKNMFGAYDGFFVYAS